MGNGCRQCDGRYDREAMLTGQHRIIPFPVWIFFFLSRWGLDLDCLMT